MPIDSFPGEKLAIKIWETLAEKGIGGLFSAWQTKRVGRATAEVRAYERRLLAQAEYDAQEIVSGRKFLTPEGSLISIERQVPALPGPSDTTDAVNSPETPADVEIVGFLRNAVARFSARELQRIVNLERIAMLASEQASGAADETVSDEPIDSDWLNRWRENAQDVSMEHMQKVWARILMGEVKSPGSYSLGTLDFLRNLSSRDAVEIASIAPFVVADSFILRDQPYLDSRRIHFSKLLELQEIGILSGIEAIGLKLTRGSSQPDSFLCVFTSYDKALVVTRTTTEPLLTLDIYRVTKLGREVLSLGEYKANVDYLQHLGTTIKAKSFNVTLADWEPLPDGRGLITNSHLL